MIRSLIISGLSLCFSFAVLSGIVVAFAWLLDQFASTARSYHGKPLSEFPTPGEMPDYPHFKLDPHKYKDSGPVCTTDLQNVPAP